MKPTKEEIEAGKAEAVAAIKKAADKGAEYKRLMESEHSNYYRAKMDLSYWQNMDA